LELNVLLQSAFSNNGARKLQNIVLFAEPHMRKRLTEIADQLPPKSVIDKMFMAPLTEEQTAAYLAHRIRAAGVLKKPPFSPDQIRTIHKVSKGLPGWINDQAFRQLKILNAGIGRHKARSLKRWLEPFIPKF
jgi:type II secretory pathway predicted ATPase ExeA